MEQELHMAESGHNEQQTETQSAELTEAQALTGISAEELESLSFEEAISRLEQELNILESGRAGLDESMAAFARGSLLAAQCRKKLGSAERRIQELVQRADGSLAEVPFGEE